MPSRKHKKNKKSHKRSKRHSSSSSEESCSPWRVPITDGDSDESLNHERLTPLVRSTYMNYLKKALTSNFEDCIKLSGELNSESVKEKVLKWTLILEQKAMRTCMVSELYRTSMASLIKQIKASTNDKKLYIENKKLSRLKSKIPSDKFSQTEPSEIQEAKIQTDLQTSSALELPLLKPSPSDVPYNPAIDFSNSSNEGVSSSLGPKQPHSASAMCSSQDICNISSTSDLFDSAEMSAGDRLKTASSEFIENNFYQTSQTSSNFGLHFLNVQCSTEKPKCIYNMGNQIINKSDEINIGSKKIITLKKRQTSIENQNPKNNLDERISALGLFADDAEDSSAPPVEKSKRSNWFAEETAQSCNFTRILMRMTTRQREKVMKKIKDLFGHENGPLTELSEANLSICRKRIASVVVMELTPIYQAKQIASRHLFKFLAKKITRSIMEKSLAPDTKSIRWRVKKFFEDGRVIKTESDCV